MKKAARKARSRASRRPVSPSRPRAAKWPSWWADFQRLNPELQQGIGIIVRRAAKTVAVKGGAR